MAEVVDAEIEDEAFAFVGVQQPADMNGSLSSAMTSKPLLTERRSRSVRLRRYR